MSIESCLKNLTDAIIANTEAMKINDAGTAVTTTANPAPPKKEAPAPPKKEDAPAPAPADIITPEELNATLVEEFNRLGNREGIDAELKKLGVTGVSDLPANQYQALIDAVKAL